MYMTDSSETTTKFLIEIQKVKFRTKICIWNMALNKQFDLKRQLRYFIENLRIKKTVDC